MWLLFENNWLEGFKVKVILLNEIRIIQKNL
jgi:hypothetical protein